MSSPNLSFQCALITGGGGGLGKAMAEYFVSLGKKVILVGRTESNLKSTAEELGKGTAYYVLDTGKIGDIPAFIRKVVKEHPEIDCIVNNAGVQRPLKIHEFDLEKADQEIDINIRGPMHLAIGFLDHLKSKEDGALIFNVSSVLGFAPSSVLNPVYCGTKAWLHFWSMNLRTQLKDTKIRVVEVVPPAVGTDLHRERDDPDDNKKHKNSISLTVEEFMDEFKQNMEQGLDTFSAGPGVKLVDNWYKTFGDVYNNAAKNWSG